MACYVDPIRTWRRPVRGKHQWCHMVADTADELRSMARTIGIRTEWIQRPGTSMEYVNLTPELYEQAIAAGAMPVTIRELGDIVDRKRLTNRPTIDSMKIDTKPAPPRNRERKGTRDELPDLQDER